jgi:eukaryotic-like serine/threonine-protein kinase
LIANLTIQLRATYPQLGWHPEGRILAITCDDKTLKLWAVDEGEKGKLVTLERTVDMGSSMAFNHQGNLLATVAWDGILRLWDPRTGKQLRTLDWRSIEVPRFSRDDRVIAASARDNMLQLWQVTAGEECRALVREADGGHPAYHDFAIQERLAAVAMEDGVGVWDVKTAAFLCQLPIGITRGVAFDYSAPEALLTNGPGGVYRWPVQAEPKSARLRIGPPQRLPLPGNEYQIAVSRDGQFVAQPAGESGARVLWRETGNVVQLAPHPDARSVAISPDGLWVATGTYNGFGARIWEARTGELVQELMPDVPCSVEGFSADGQWLVTRCPLPQLWNTRVWEKTAEHPGGACAFSPDGRVLAVETGAGVVRLLDPASGAELARLENPNHEKSSQISFSNDGALMATVGGESDPMYVWDLRKMRRKLAEFGLDWDLPAYPPENANWSHGALQLQVDLGAFSSKDP